MKITFICVGPIKKAYVKKAVDEYCKRIGRYVAFEVVEVREAKATVKTPRDIVKAKEGERIRKKMKPSEFNISLGDGGVEYTSEGLAGLLEKTMAGGKKGISFIVGGPFGLDAPVVEASDMELSLSRMTLPHDLARLVLAEQVYRAFTIMRGEPYSH